MFKYFFLSTLLTFLVRLVFNYYRDILKTLGTIKGTFEFLTTTLGKKNYEKYLCGGNLLLMFSFYSV